jgi:hypothetical protein
VAEDTAAAMVVLSLEQQDLADDLVRSLGVIDRGRLELEVEHGVVTTAWKAQRLRRAPRPESDLPPEPG